MGCRAPLELVSNADIWISFKKGKELSECEYCRRQQVAWANWVGCGYL